MLRYRGLNLLILSNLMNAIRSKGDWTSRLSNTIPNGNTAMISTDILNRNDPSRDLGVLIMTVESVRVSWRLTVYYVGPILPVSSSLVPSRFDAFTNTNMWNSK